MESDLECSETLSLRFQKIGRLELERQVLKQSSHLFLSHMEKVDFEIKREWKNREQTLQSLPSRTL